MIETWFNQDITKAVKITHLDGNIFSQDNRGNLIGVNVFNNGEPVALSGMAYANVIRADGTTVTVVGSISGNHASVILPESAYAVPGVISIIVKLTADGATTTMCAVVANVYKSSTDAVVDPGELITGIDALIAALEEATTGLDNLANRKVNKPEDDPDGTYGQSLRTNGDGTTYWANEGQPTDAQVAEAVSDWLDEHPEATTTVQDGSISRVKLDSAVGKVIDWAHSVKFYFPNLSEGSYSGSCSLVTVNGKALLFDAYTSESWTLIQDWLDGLQSDGVFSNIDYILISHYHNDHVGSLTNILGRYPHVNCNAYIPQSIAGHAAEQAYLVTNYNNIVSALSTAGVTTHIVDDDVSFQITDFFEVELFNCSNTDYLYYDTLYTGGTAIYNNYCMVALLRCGDVYSMYPGDIQSDAQKRIMATRTLPRLFVYPVHHHGIQSDDYIPYLEAINPQYDLISTSHNRVMVSATSSSGMNFFTGQKGCTAYDEYSYVCDKDGGQIVNGRAIQKVGYGYFQIDLYVDNEYAGPIYDGSEEHPFTQINEALMFVNRGSNLRYTIRVKGTSTRYDFMWIRDYFSPVSIIGYKDANGANVYPSIHGGYIGEGTYVSLAYLSFDGDGRDQYDFHPMLFIMASTVYMNGCSFDGANIPAGVTATKIGIYIQETRTVYMTGCTISNLANGVRSYRYGGITSGGTTFVNISSSGYNVVNTELRLRGKDTLTDIGSGSWILSQASGGATPIMTDAGCIDSTMAAKCSKYAVSLPFFGNNSHVSCMLSNQKIYDVFTGSEVTIS